MKITDPKAMQSGEKAFFKVVKDHLDWNAIREVVTEKMKQCSIDSKDGELIFHENTVAFKINFHCAMDVSIVVDRSGNLVSDENPLSELHMAGPSPVVDPETPTKPIPPASTKDTKKSQKTQTFSQPVPPVGKSDEADAPLDDDAGVLELNDLLDELKPEQDADDFPPPPDKKSKKSSKDEDMDLETLFFKDSDDDDQEDELDTLEDEATAFWEDKK